MQLPSYPASLRRGIPPARALAIATVADRERPRPSRPGSRLYWMSGDVLGCRDVPADLATFLVIGRHTQCDAVLDLDPSVALRHLLVSALPGDDGRPILRILDLRTHDGFELSDGTVQRSVFAEGPLVLGVGAYTLVALPTGGPDRQAPRAPTPRIEQHPYRMAPHTVEPDPVARPEFRSRITILPRALDLGERASSCGLEPAPARAWELTLESRGGRAQVWLSADDLDRGVLVGRDPRCLDAGLRAVLSEGISRVHLLLLRNGRSCRAIDVASSQGTLHEGRPVRAIALAQYETTLTLAQVREHVVRLRLRAIRLDELH